MYKYSLLLITILHLCCIPNSLVAGLEDSSYVCSGLDELPDNDQKDLHQISDRHIKLLKSGSYEALYENSHPQFKQNITREQFQKVLQTVSPRIELTSEIEFTDANRLNFVSGKPLKGKPVICGSVEPTDESHRVIYPVAGITNQLLLYHIAHHPTIERILTLQFGQDGKEYKLLRFNMNVTKFNRKDADHFEKTADFWLAKKQYISSILAYSTALRFSTPGNTIATAGTIRIKEKIAALSKDENVKRKLLYRIADGHDYKIIRYDTIETVNEVAPTIVYLTNYDLGQELEIKNEAQLLLDHLKTHTPELGDHFDTILFQAFKEIPTSPQKEYQSYRVALKINR